MQETNTSLVIKIYILKIIFFTPPKRMETNLSLFLNILNYSENLGNLNVSLRALFLFLGISRETVFYAYLSVSSETGFSVVLSIYKEVSTLLQL